MPLKAGASAVLELPSVRIAMPTQTDLPASLVNVNNLVNAVTREVSTDELPNVGPRPTVSYPKHLAPPTKRSARTPAGGHH